MPSFSNVGFADGSLLYTIDSHSRYWLGLGELVINQQTQLPASSNPFQYETESSRVAGARYEAELKLPVNKELLVLGFADLPALHGTYFASNCKDCLPSEFSTSEKAEMTDTSALFELPRGRSTWAFGFRYIYYSAVFPDYYQPADQNVGFGLILRYMFSLTS